MGFLTVLQSFLQILSLISDSPVKNLFGQFVSHKPASHRHGHLTPPPRAEVGKRGASDFTGCYSGRDPHQVPSKSLLVGLEGPVSPPPLKDRTGQDCPCWQQLVADEIMVRPYNVEMMAQPFPDQPGREKQAIAVDNKRPANLLCFYFSLEMV